MNISEIIERLQKIKDRCGDLEVCVCTDDIGEYAAPSRGVDAVCFNDQRYEYEFVCDADDDIDEYKDAIDGLAVFIRF